MDFSIATHHVRLAFSLSYVDVLNRYRRSLIGPFWITISIAVMISSIALVYGRIFDVPMKDYLPFLTCGIILWYFISGTVNESCLAFISSDSLIRQLALPHSVHLLRVFFRNLIFLGHHFLIIPIVLIVFEYHINMNIFWVIPGFFLLASCTYFLGAISAFVSTRYRDVAQIIANLFVLFFYLTPIIWMPKLLEDQSGISSIFLLNPFHHMLLIVRDPILGKSPSLLSWGFVISFMAISCGLTLFLFRKYKNRIIYWL